MLGGISNDSNIMNIISLLTGKALTWATAVWEKIGETVSSYEHFIAIFRRIFDHAPEGKAVGEPELPNMP